MRRLWMLALALACGGDDLAVPTPFTPVVTTVVLTQAPTAPLFIGERLTLGVTVRDQRGDTIGGSTPSWASSKPEVASVGPNGTLTAVAEGVTLITVTVAGKSDVAPVFVGGPRITLATAAAASAVIGPSGGTLTAPAPGGGEYVLDVPAGALMTPQTITMTPIERIAKLPLSGGFAGGIEFAPSGLRFARPATLRIPLRARPEPGFQLLALSYEGDGGRLVPGLSIDSGTVAILPIAHFSGVAAGFGTTADLQQLFTVPIAPINNTPTIVETLAVLLASSPVDQAAVRSLMRQWLVDVIEPLFANAVTDEALLLAVTDLNRWLAVPPLLGIAQSWPAAFPAEYAEVSGMAALSLLAAIEGNAEVCGAQQSFTALQNVAFWHRHAAALGVATTAHAMSTPQLIALVEQKCVTLELESDTLAASMEVGVPYSLSVVWSLAFRGAAGVTQGAPVLAGFVGLGNADVTSPSPIFSDQTGYATAVIEATAPGTVEILIAALLLEPGTTTVLLDGLGQSFVNQSKILTRGAVDPPAPPPPPPPPPPTSNLTGTWELTIRVRCSNNQSGHFVTTVTFVGGIATFSNLAASQFICVGGPFRLSGRFSGTVSTDPNGVQMLSNARLSQLTWSGTGVTGCTDVDVLVPGPLPFVSGFNGFSGTADVPTQCNLLFNWTGFSLRFISP